MTNRHQPSLDRSGSPRKGASGSDIVPMAQYEPDERSVIEQQRCSSTWIGVSEKAGRKRRRHQSFVELVAVRIGFVLQKRIHAPRCGRWVARDAPLSSLLFSMLPQSDPRSIAIPIEEDNPSSLQGGSDVEKSALIRLPRATLKVDQCSGGDTRRPGELLSRPSQHCSRAPTLLRRDYHNYCNAIKFMIMYGLSRSRTFANQMLQVPAPCRPP